MNVEMDKDSRVQEYYRGTSVLVTGFSGFMGKVLVEKLLRSCHHLHKVYVIVRSKRGKTAQQRVQKLLDVPLWERLANEKPGVIEEKLVVLEGDVREVGLGLEPQQLETLRSQVDVVFHVAAAVSFDQPIDLALQANTVSTKNVLDIALEMPSLKCFVHVSTAYSNFDRKLVEERVYPAHADWRDTLDIGAKVDPQLFRILEEKYVGNMGNTYLFTKSLAEHVVWEQRHKIPVIIFRPSIVTASYSEPVPGWIDNFNGPFSLFIGYATGVIRTLLIDPDVHPDSMPVDLVINAMVVAPSSPGRNTDGMVYNASSEEARVSWDQVMKTGEKLTKQFPMEKAIWNPGVHITKSLFWFKLNVWYRHIFLALLVDTLLRLTKNKPMLMHVHRRYYKVVLILTYFMNCEWKFKNANFLSLNDELSPVDKADFRFHATGMNGEKFLTVNFLGGKKYLLKDFNSNPRRTMIKAWIIYWLDWVVDCLKWTTIMWLLWRWGVFHTLQTLVTSATARLQ